MVSLRTSEGSILKEWEHVPNIFGAYKQSSLKAWHVILSYRDYIHNSHQFVYIRAQEIPEVSRYFYILIHRIM